MTNLLAVALISLIGINLAGAGPATAAAVRGPSGCPAGLDPKKWVCYTIEEDAEVRLGQIQARFELQRLSVRAKRIGGAVGCGVGVVAEIEHGEATVDAAPVCAAIFGWRF